MAELEKKHVMVMVMVGTKIGVLMSLLIAPNDDSFDISVVGVALVCQLGHSLVQHGDGNTIIINGGDGDGPLQHRDIRDPYRDGSWPRSSRQGYWVHYATINGKIIS